MPKTLLKALKPLPSRDSHPFTRPAPPPSEPGSSKTKSPASIITVNSSCKSGEASTSRSTAWVFTTTTHSNVALETETAVVLVGPEEEDGSAHGLIYWKHLDGAARRQQVRKLGAFKEIQQALPNIILKEGYLKPLKKLMPYMSYAYKSVSNKEDDSNWGVAVSLLQKIGARVEFGGDSYMVRMREWQREMGSKPAWSHWRQKCQEEFNFKISKQTMLQGYNNWPTDSGRLQEGLEKVFQQADDMSLFNALKLVLEADKCIQLGVDQGNTIAPHLILPKLVWVALKHRAREVSKVPHILLSGDAGTGKTLLGGLLLRDSLTSNVCLDATGVGVFGQEGVENLYKFDDVPSAMFTDPAKVATIMTMHGNQWESKEHGGHQKHEPAIAWVTTNETHAQNLMEITHADKYAFVRRFLTVNFVKGPGTAKAFAAIEHANVTEDVKVGTLAMLAQIFVEEGNNCDAPWYLDIIHFVQENGDFINELYEEYPEIATLKRSGRIESGGKVRMTPQAMGRIRSHHTFVYPNNVKFSYLQYEYQNHKRWEKFRKWLQAKIGVTMPSTKMHKDEDGCIIVLNYKTGRAEQFWGFATENVPMCNTSGDDKNYEEQLGT